MPRYTYTAKSQPDKTIQVNIEAETEQAAVNKLNQMGYFPISLQPEGLALDKGGTLRFWKVSSRDVVLFTRQLSNLIESGVNILSSLNIISNQTPNKYLKVILNDVIGKIKDGKALSESLGAHPNLFFGLYAAMIHSGEVGGGIELSLKHLADFLEKEEEFKNSIRQALTYPFFIFAVSALTVIVLLGFVIPRFVSMFEEMGQVLPLPTKILINLSGVLRSYWLLILAIIFVFIFLLRRLYNTSGGRISLDRLKLKLVLFGEIILKAQIGRLMRTLSVLLSSGLPIIESLNISGSVLTNEILKMEIQRFKDEISKGSSLSGCLKNSNLFPEFVENIVAVGEETGALEKSLLRIADEYEKEVDRSLRTLTRLLEPVIILVMGLIVGFIVLSMLLPIFQINLIVR